MLLSLLGIKPDVLVFLVLEMLSIIFATVSYTPAFGPMFDAIDGAPESSGARHNQVLRVMRASKPLAGWVWCAETRMLVCLSDGFGCYLGLMVTFAIACKVHPFTLFIHFSGTEATQYTTVYEGAPSTEDWETACETGGHLLAWVGQDVWIKVSDTDLSLICARCIKTDFAKEFRNILKQLQNT